MELWTQMLPGLDGSLEPRATNLPDFSDIRLMDMHLHNAEAQLLDGGKYLLGGKLLIGRLSHEPDGPQLQLTIDQVNIKVARRTTKSGSPARRPRLHRSRRMAAGARVGATCER